MVISISIEERLKNYIVDPFTGCHIWSRCKNKKGYGKFGYLGAHILAHRASYEVHKGKIPKGQMIRHLCHNPPCINPKHLTVGTARDNIWDCIKANRRRYLYGEQHQNSKATNEIVAQIRKLRKKGITLRELSALFHLAESTIHNIDTQKTWSKK